MASLTTKTFSTLVSDQVASIQGACNSLLDFTIGSVLRSIIEANSTVVLWIQGLILQLLTTTRAATSNGADLDSFVADFGVSRLAAAQASGHVTFSRFTAMAQAVVPVNSLVQSTDGAQKYTVTIDAGNAAYSAALGGYVMAAGVSSVIVPVQAVTAGAAANAVIGGVSTLGQAIAGIDTVTNAIAFTNGADAESDAALRTRFIAYIASLSKATKAAIGYIITAMQQGLVYSLTENYLYAGAYSPGYFYVVVDDGTGYPSSTLLSSVANAVDSVRAFTITFGVFAPVVETADVSMTISTASGYDHAATVDLVVAALSSYINTLALGQALPYSRLAQIAYDASPGVVNATSVLLNGGTSDLSATAKQVIKSGSLAVA